MSIPTTTSTLLGTSMLPWVMTLYGWAKIPSRPRFGRLKSSKNGEKLLQFCKANSLCIMNRIKKGRKATRKHGRIQAKSVKDYMLMFGKERAQICL